MESISGISVFWFWLALAGLLLITELMLMPTGFLLIAAGAAACLSLLSFLLPWLSINWQLAIFAVLTLTLTFVWRFLIHKPAKKRVVEQAVNARAEQMLGYHTVLTEDLVNGRGRIKVNDASWPVLAVDDYKAGTKVEVVEVRGITLVVQKSSEAS